MLQEDIDKLVICRKLIDSFWIDLANATTEEERAHLQKKIQEDLVSYGFKNVNEFKNDNNQMPWKSYKNNKVIGVSTNTERKVEFTQKKIAPGITYRLSTMEELSLWVDQHVKSGVYTEQEAFNICSSLLSNEWGWPVVTEYNGEILQLEYFQFNENDFTKVYGGFASHINKSRPHWFWTKFGKILLESFVKLGVESVDVSILSKYSTYVEFIKKTYGAVVIDDKKDSRVVSLQYSVKEALKNLPVDPVRKSLGKDWAYLNRGILIREGSEADFPDINNYISKLWSDSSRKDLVNKVFNDTWNLDNASILMIYENGILFSIQTIRQRTEDRCGFAHLGNLSNINDNIGAIIFEGKHLWEKQVGYKEETTFVEASFVTHPTVIKKTKDRHYDIKYHDLPTGKVAEFIYTL